MDEWPDPASSDGVGDTPTPATPPQAATPPPPPSGLLNQSTTSMDPAAQRMAHYDAPARSAPNATTPPPPAPPGQFGAPSGFPAASPHTNPQYAASQYPAPHQQAPHQQAPHQQAPHQPVAHYPAPSGTSSSKKPWIIAAVVLVLLLFVGVGLSIFAFASGAGELLEELAETGTGVGEDRIPGESEFQPGNDAAPVSEDTTSIDVAADRVEAFDGELSPNGFDSFLLDLDAGDSLIISAEANGSGLDTLLVAVGPSGEQIDANDDASSVAGLSGNLDSQVEFEAPASGTYTLEVIGYDEFESGSYVLTVDRSG